MISDYLTDRQLQVLVFINVFRARNQCNPTMAEIAAHFGWVSPNAAQDHVNSMMRKGALTNREPHRKKRQHARGYLVTAPWDEYIS